MVKRYLLFWDVMLLSCRNMRLAFCGVATKLRQTVGCQSVISYPPSPAEAILVIPDTRLLYGPYYERTSGNLQCGYYHRHYEL